MVIGTLAIGAVAVGCGGSGGSLTKAEFINQADAICKKAEEERLAGFQESPKVSASTSKKAMAAIQQRLLTAVVLPSIQTEAEELGDLAAPSGDEAKVAAIVEAYEQAVKEVEANPSTQGKAFPKFNKLAPEYGLKDCTV